ncbi:MAG: bifunctional folylpolyglutamate synthase/dihydrofolate synthase [Rhodospirillales bacterium]
MGDKAAPVRKRETTEPRSDKLLRRLLDLHPKKIDLSLGRIEGLLTKLGHPEQSLPPVIHVAGTNGKGSVAAFLRALFEAAGLKVHVFTSPHLVRFHERIRLAGEGIDEEALADLLAEVETVNDGAPITFFEITTAAALLAFSRTPADVCLLEVGLGGRLDATNVVARPAVTVITPVSLDHTDFLGRNLSSIQGEKAGILKAGTPAVVYTDRGAKAAAPIAAKAEDVGAPLTVERRDWNVAPVRGGFDYHGIRADFTLPLPQLAGAHQLRNAGLALAAAEHLPGFKLTRDVAEQAMRTVQWPARLQHLTTGRLVRQVPPNWEIWLDGGHNPAAGAALAAHAAANWSDRPLYLVLGMLTTKGAQEFLRMFSGLVESCHPIWVPFEEASRSPSDLADKARKAGIRAVPAPSAEAALSYINLHEARPARVLITGSLYLAGSILGENG